MYYKLHLLVRGQVGHEWVADTTSRRTTWRAMARYTSCNRSPVPHYKMKKMAIMCLTEPGIGHLEKQTLPPIAI